MTPVDRRIEQAGGGMRASECTCDMRTKVLGDGCEVCNPAKALEYAKETIADLERTIAALETHRQQVRIALGLLPLDHGGDVIGRIRGLMPVADTDGFFGSGTDVR